jgi:hypothetical protein
MTAPARSYFVRPAVGARPGGLGIGGIKGIARDALASFRAGAGVCKTQFKKQRRENDSTSR